MIDKCIEILKNFDGNPPDEVCRTCFEFIFDIISTKIVLESGMHCLKCGGNLLLKGVVYDDFEFDTQREELYTLGEPTYLIQVVKCKDCNATWAFKEPIIWDASIYSILDESFVDLLQEAELVNAMRLNFI